jgi:hypothetical protein
VIGRTARAFALFATLVAGCVSARAPSVEAAGLVGTWRGRMSGPQGNAPIILTIAEDGTFQGLLFVEPKYKEIKGAISVLSPGNIRYEGNDGNGRVTVREKHGQRVLRFVRDGGGGGGELTPAK